MKTAVSGLIVFVFSWALAFMESAYFGWNDRPQSGAEWGCIAVCLAIFAFGLWLMINGLSKLKTAQTA